MGSPRVGRLWAAMWVVVLTIVIVGPTLGPGFVLTYDMVFTPRQDLLPASLGVGSGLPRAVPQDAVVALIEGLVPGMLVQKVVLVAIPLLTGLGMLRLLAPAGAAAGAVGATLAMLAPFVAQRLALGHWGLLLAYSLVPWSLVIARDVRSSGRWQPAVRLVLTMALAGITPSGSLLVGVLALPIALGPRSALAVRQRCALGAAAVATWLPWLLPSLLHPQVGSSDIAGADLFGLRSEGWWGALLTSLGTGGIWNADVVLASREWLVAPASAVVVLALAVIGWQSLIAVVGRATAVWLLVASAAGLAAALMSSTAAWAWLIAQVPGGGLARDAHKLLAPLSILLAAAAAVGVLRLASRIPDRAGRAALLVAALLLPIALQPDVVWGQGSRLTPVEYPQGWAMVRSELERSPESGDVLVLPWTAFRRYAWNDDRTMLDPAPRWLPRSTVSADGLPIQTPQGVVTIAGDDPRSAQVTAALAEGEGWPGILDELGVGWVLVDGVEPPEMASVRAAAIEVVGEPGLRLYRLTGAAPVPRDLAGLPAVIATDLLVAAGLVLALWALAWARIRQVSADRRHRANSLLP